MAEQESPTRLRWAVALFAAVLLAVACSPSKNAVDDWFSQEARDDYNALNAELNSLQPALNADFNGEGKNAARRVGAAALAFRTVLEKLGNPPAEATEDVTLMKQRLADMELNMAGIDGCDGVRGCPLDLAFESIRAYSRVMTHFSERWGIAKPG